jgi:hypothetical protein
MQGPSFGSMKAVEALPDAQYTATTNGDAFTSFYTIDDPRLDLFTGYFRQAAVYVDQSAGSGNNPGVNQFTITLQGRHSSGDNWANIPLSSTIAITANGAAGYFATAEGPLPPYLRVVANESGNADATFQVHVYLLA